MLNLFLKKFCSALSIARKLGYFCYNFSQISFYLLILKTILPYCIFVSRFLLLFHTNYWKVYCFFKLKTREKHLLRNELKCISCSTNCIIKRAIVNVLALWSAETFYKTAWNGHYLNKIMTKQDKQIYKNKFKPKRASKTTGIILKNEYSLKKYLYPASIQTSLRSNGLFVEIIFAEKRHSSLSLNFSTSLICSK